MKSPTSTSLKNLFNKKAAKRCTARRQNAKPLDFESLENRMMLSAVKWSAADFELINAENPEGEPWLAAAPDGRFRLTFYESFNGPPAYTDIETRHFTAAGNDTTQSTAPTFSAATIDRQATSAYMPDGREVVVWTEEPAAGGGDLEDVYAQIYTGTLISLPRFLVSGGAARQHDPVVATNGNGFVVAMADSSVAGGRLILKFYNAVGGLITTVNAPDAPEGVQLASHDQYRDVEITALANGNYVVTWADTTQDIWARIYNSNGTAQTGLIDIESAGPNATFPDVSPLADGRFLVTYGQYQIDTVRGRIYETNGTPSTGPFTIATGALNNLQQQVQSAALQDGRFVTVWVTTTGNIQGRVMFADGTADGAAFAINGDNAGNKGRPTVATLADGRFAVAWESGAGAAQTIFATIFDARDAGLKGSASGFNDDWHGTNFGDQVYGGTGADEIRGAGGADRLYGEAGNDTLDGDAGNDRLEGGNNNDILRGAQGNDTLFGQLGDDTLNGGSGNDSLHGSSGDDTLTGGTGVDSLRGGLGEDLFVFLNTGESGLLALRDKIVDFSQAQSDLIDVSSIDGKTSDPLSATFTFIGNAAFTAEGQIRAFQVNDTAVVEFNTTGNNGAEMQIALVDFTAANLTINDFLVPPMLMQWYGSDDPDGTIGFEQDFSVLEVKNTSTSESDAIGQFDMKVQAVAFSVDAHLKTISDASNSDETSAFATPNDLVILDSVFAILSTI